MAGYTTLAGLKKQILNDNCHQLPDSLQFLWIGYPEHAKAHPGLAELEEHEQILLEPQFEQASQVIGQNYDRYSYLAWWTASRRNNRLSRANGRFSLFWMLYFENQAQRLSDALKHVNIKLGSCVDARYRVFFVTNLFEPISSILIDLAHLVRQALPPQKIKFLIPILLVNSDGENVPREQKAGVIAAMRELERFMSGREQLLTPGNFGRSTITKPFLFDHLLAFDKANAQMHIADLLFGLLQQEIADKFDEALIKSPGTDVSEQFLFSNISVFTYYFPLAEIRRVCAARLLQDELFSVPQNRIESRTAGQFPLASFSAGRQDDFISLAKSFLRDDRHQFESSAFPLDVLAQIHDRQSPTFPVQAMDFPNLTEMLQTRLAVYLNQVMYTGRSQPSARRPYGTLGWALEFLKALRKITIESRLFLERQRANPFANNLASQLDNLRTVADLWMREIERWQKAIDQIRLRVNQHLLDEQSSLQRSAENTFVHQVPLPKANGGTGSGDLSQSYYQSFIEQPAGVNARAAIRNRTGWFWKVHHDPEKTCLNWLVFGPAEDLENWTSALHSYIPDELENAFFRLIALAEFYTRQIGQDKSVIDLLRETPSSQIVQPFKTPRFLLETLPVPAPSRATDYYLAGPDQNQIIEWAARNRLVELSQRTIQIDDPTRLLHLVVDRNLPKQSLKFMADYQPLYYRDPGLHIFLEEQNAALIEREYGLMETLHPRLVRLMGNLDEFRLTLRLVLYGWVHEEFDGLHRTWVIHVPGRMPIPLEDDAFPKPNSLESALALFLIFIPNVSLNSAHPIFKGNYSGTLQLLQTACDTYWESIRQKDAQEKQILFDGYQQQIGTWLNSSDDFLHSLGLVLKRLFARENL